jgi:hypothetical protein
VESWTVQLLTILGVAVGAAGSFISTRLLEHSKWQREVAHRWDAKRLKSYTQFATSIKDLINLSKRISVGLGLPGSAHPLDAAEGLSLLTIAAEDLSLKMENVLMLGSPEVIEAARDWRHTAWHLESFARGVRDNVGEYSQAKIDSSEARRSFYSAVRADLGIVSGSIPEVDGPPPWQQIGERSPDKAVG